MKKIAVIGLNPAWQKNLFFENLEFAEVNRAYKVESYASGKGINFCHAARIHNTSETILFQFTGGDTGRNICNELDREEFRHQSIVKEYTTRTCSTCLCAKTNSMTELIEPSGGVSEKDLSQLLDRLSSCIKEINGIAICGTAPDGAKEFDCYAKIAGIARENKLPLLVDSYRDIIPTLKNGATILKVNTYELKQISGKGSVSEAFGYCFAEYDLRCIVATDGKQGAYFGDGGCVCHLKLPELEAVVNPLGAGDTVSAVLFSEFLSGGSSCIDGLKTAMGAASASCLSSRCAQYSVEKAEEITEKITIDKI